jgi:hypothetical protein
MLYHFTQAQAIALSDFTLAWDYMKGATDTDPAKVVKRYTAVDSIDAVLPLVDQCADKHAYEVIREGKPVNPYFDIEWLDPVITEEQRLAADAVDRVVMRAYVDRLREHMTRALAPYGIRALISVTTSTRSCVVSVKDAKKYGAYVSWLNNGGAPVAGVEATNDDWVSCDKDLMMPGPLVKRSYHIVTQGLVFVGGNTDAHFNEFRSGLPDLCDINSDPLWGPRVPLGAPDKAVYTKNRNLRLFGCSKLTFSKHVWPDAVKRFDYELTDTTDPSHTLVRYFIDTAQYVEAAAPCSKEVAKTSKCCAAPRVAEFQQAVAELQQSQGPRLAAMSAACQRILHSCGDATTVVLGLKEVNQTSGSLRFETSNQGERRCLAGDYRHSSNNAFIWLEPQDGGSPIADVYLVQYMCPSGTCARAIVTLAEIRWDGTNYNDKLTIPPILKRSSRRPPGFVPAVGVQDADGEQTAGGPIRSTHPTASYSDAGVPFSYADLTDMLRSKGDLHSIPTSHHWEENNQQWRVNCRIFPKGNHRQCLLTKCGSTARLHDGNNCILFLKQTGHSTFSVKYVCGKAECRQGGKHIMLGFIGVNAAEAEKEEAITSDNLIAAVRARMQAPPSTLGSDPYAVFLSNPAANLIDAASLENNGYDLFKERFEKKPCFKLMEPVGYAHFVQGELKLLDAARFVTAYKHMRYYDAETGKWETFINRWMGDPTMQLFSNLTFNPEKTSEGEFNLWRGLRAARLPPIESDEEVRRLAAPVMELFRNVLANQNEAVFKWLWIYYSFIAQRPHMRTMVALYFLGEEGAGKGTFNEFFRLRILGEEVTFQTADVGRDLFSTFANGFVNKIFIQGDEVRHLGAYTEDIKNFLTNKTANYESKGVNRIVLNNYTNLVLTSNNRRTLTISKKDRRWCLFECNNMYLGNKVYWDRMTDHLERPDVARAIYQLLMATDLSGYGNHLQSGRPKTAYYREVQNSCLPSICQFLSHAVNEPGKYLAPITATELYKQYSEFHYENHMKRADLLCMRDFAQDIIKYNGVMKRRSNGHSKYSIDVVLLKASLVMNGNFDADVDDEEEDE